MVVDPSIHSGTSNSRRNKKKRGPDDDLASAIRDFSNSKRRSELSVQKLEYMAREEARREKEEARREKETSMALRESKWKEWDVVNSNIRMFREAAMTSLEHSYSPTADEDLEVLDGLKKRRRELGKDLGIIEESP